MKMRKRIAALIAAAMIAALMPMSAFAKSDNKVDRIVSYAKDVELEEHAPVLTIKLEDDFTSGQAFYLNLENAEWVGDVGDEVADTSKVIATITGDTTVRVVPTDLGKETIFKIPLYTKLTGGEATVEVNPEGTVVTRSKHVFANSSSDGKAIVTVGDADTFVNTGGVADITLAEPYTKAFKDATSAGIDDNQVTIELRDSDFEFVVGIDAEVEYLVGFDVLTGVATIDTDPQDDGILIITLPNTTDATQRGEFKIKGVEVRRVDRNAAKGEVKATLRGEIIDGTEEIVVAKYGDYETKIELEDEDGYKGETGKFVDVEFKLSEGIENALLKNRSVTFSFSKGVKIKKLEIKSNSDESRDFTKSYKNESRFIDSKDKHNSFTIDNFGNARKPGETVEYTFKARLAVPNAFDEKEIELIAEGRALSETHKLVVAEMTKAVEVEVEPIDIKVGLQKQVGGKIVIKENAKEAILRNYKDTNDDSVSNAEIRIQIGDDNNYTDGLRITDADIEVTEGDLVLDLDEKRISGGTIIIPVKRQSTKPSTIEVTNIEITANRVVPEGKYNLKIGGTALSTNTDVSEFITDRAFDDDLYETYDADEKEYILHFLDPIIAKDFINITTKNPEDLTPGSGAEVVSFVIGNNKFIVDGVEVEMDAAPYIKDGRTMVPVRYLAEALGIDGAAVKFNAGVVTLFAADGKVIQVSVGSKNLVVNGMTIPMVAAAEIVEGRTYVPVTEIGVVFGVSGSWDPATQTATFSKN